MTRRPPYDSIEAFTGGDVRAAAFLRQNLVGLRDQLAAEPSAAELRRDLQAVLDGRLGMRELAKDGRFRSIAEEGMRGVHEAWLALPDDERAAQLRAGAQVDRSG